MRALFIFVAGVTYGLAASSCGASAETAARGSAMTATSAACTAVRQQILDRHGDEATPEDEADMRCTVRLCAAILDELEQQENAGAE